MTSINKACKKGQVNNRKGRLLKVISGRNKMKNSGKCWLNKEEIP